MTGSSSGFSDGRSPPSARRSGSIVSSPRCRNLEHVELAPATAQVIVTMMEPTRITEYARVTRELRQAGIRTEMYLGDEKGLGKQLQYANRQQIPFAVIIGSDEFASEEITIKNLKLGGTTAG